MSSKRNLLGLNIDKLEALNEELALKVGGQEAKFSELNTQIKDAQKRLNPLEKNVEKSLDQIVNLVQREEKLTEDIAMKTNKLATLKSDVRLKTTEKTTLDKELKDLGPKVKKEKKAHDKQMAKNKTILKRDRKEVDDLERRAYVAKEKSEKLDRVIENKESIIKDIDKWIKEVRGRSALEAERVKKSRTLKQLLFI